MRAEARPPRRKWPWIVAGAAAVTLAAVGGVGYANSPPVMTLPADASAVPTPEATSTAAGTVDAAPTGCLGGPERNAAMLLAAQAEAPHSRNGAVDFAASFMRWLGRYPVPSQDEAKTVQAAVLTPDTAYDLSNFLTGDPNLSNALVPNGTPFYLSTVPGVWYLESYSDTDAVVSIGTGIVIDGALHPTFRMSGKYELAWTDGGWKVEAAKPPRPTEQLFPAGTTFTVGC